MSTATTRAYKPYFIGRVVPFEMPKSPQNKAFYGHRDTYSGKAHCIKDKVLLDPCCGSGHILAYMFDVLVQIYGAYGISSRDAAASIVKNNIYGLDIDERAAQLAQFSVMMKARQYDRRFFSRDVQPNVYAIEDSNGITSAPLHDMGIGLSSDDYSKAVKQIMQLIDEFHDAKEYGSIINVSEADWDLLRRFAVPRWMSEGGQISFEIHGEIDAAPRLQHLISIGQSLSQKYHVVVTNPPYMGSRKSMNPTIKRFVEKNYPDSKSDLYTVFIERCLNLTIRRGLAALVTQQSFMFTDDYKELRVKLIHENHFISMIHLGADAFPEINGEVVQTTAFVLSAKNTISDYNACFVRAVDYPCNEKPNAININKNKYYCSSNKFENVKAMPFSYWISEKMRQSFDNGVPFEEYGNPRAGITTGENDRFMRYWFEVERNKIGIGYPSVEAFHESKKLYIPYNKGGKQIRWYGNNDYVLMFDKKNYEILSNQGNHLPSRQYYCRECITWSDISGRSFAARYCMQGSVFDVKGSCGFPEKNRFWLSLALLNSKLTPKYIDSLNPTTTTQVGDLKRIPVVAPSDDAHKKIDELAKECVKITKAFYDSEETSWDFDHNPLIRSFSTISSAYADWKQECTNHFNQLKADEEELNRIFIEIYGLQNELTPDVEDKDVTVNKDDLRRDIRFFISYAVGCMLGRYSLDQDGLAFAGGKWDMPTHQTFLADKDGILPICDDEYFDDDITGLFVKFVETVFGKDTLEENLKFIADALGRNGSPREIIRNYFLNDFYSDHLKIYQKHPIYWLFDSGKKNGFKCLIYMHRYQPDTIARIRTDYVHEQQSRYRTAIADLEQRIESASTSDRVKLSKKLKHLQEQSAEIHDYEEKIHHLADQYISIDLDDGVKANYAKFQDILAKIK